MATWKHKLSKNLHWLFLGTAALLTLYMNIYVAGSLLDGDASQMMQRGWLIAREKNLFTRDVYLTTDASFMDASVVAAFFFLFISDWTLVRVLTMVTLQSWYVLGFLFLCRQSGVRRQQAVYAAGFLLLPVSTAYARIVLYHMYYLHNIANMFWMTGLTARLIAGRDRRQTGTWLLLGVFWALAGLEGIRYMMIIGMPMLACLFVALLRTLKDYQWENGRLTGENPFGQTPVCRYLTVMLMACAAFAVGYVINQNVILRVFGVRNSSHSWFLPDPDPTHYAQIVLGWLKANGVRESINQLVGLRGIAIAACLALLCCVTGMSARGLTRAGQNEPLEKNLVRGLYAAALCTFTLIFLFDSPYRVYELYYLPAVALTFPTLAQEMSDLTKRGMPASRKLLLLLTCACLLFQGAYTAWFIRVDRDTADKWSGLVYQAMGTTDQLRDCVDFMQANGYTHGLIDYWYANVMVEMTDGERIIAPLDDDFTTGKIASRKWGTFRSDFEPENLPEKVIVFIKHADCRKFEAQFPALPQVMEGWIFTAYEADAGMISEPLRF